MPNQIFFKSGFAVYPARDGYIVHNINRQFQDGHTHVRNLGMAKKLIYYAAKKDLPRRTDLRFLYSLARITDGAFSLKVNELADIKRDKGKKQIYYNPAVKKSLKQP